MRKIISSILTVVVILTSFSAVAFAAADTNLYFGDGSTTINATEDTIDLTLYLDKSDEDILTYGYTTLEIVYNFTNATVDATELKTSSDFNYNCTANEVKLFYGKSGDFYVPASAKDSLATYSITRKDNADTTVITIDSVLLSDSVTPYTYQCTYPTTVTINWPGEEEEEFEATYEGVKAEDGTVSEGFAAGSKVATVFAKAETALTAGTYGIVFGGQKYVGAGNVAEGKYWVIRLYDPSGEILTGTYDCQKFVGEAVEAADYKLETK